MPLFLLFGATTIIAQAEYDTGELLAKSSEAHARLDRFSMQIWTRSFSWNGDRITQSQSAVSKIVQHRKGLVAIVGVARHSYSYTSLQKTELSTKNVSRFGLRIEPGPRFLLGEWAPEKGELINRPITAGTYRKEFRPHLSRAFASSYPFGEALFFTNDIHHPRPGEIPQNELRMAGRENVAGHECIRLDSPGATYWFDAKSLLVRRVMHQTERPSAGTGNIRDLFFDIRPLADAEVPNLAPALDETFEDNAMQWVPFIPFEQLRENLRITGRAAGLLIAPPEDQPQAQPALPPLTPEQRAAIVTIEGDVLSGLGFYTRYRDNDFLITDVQFVSENRWLKIRDWRGNALAFTAALQAENSRVVLLKTSSVPGRLTPSFNDRKKKNAFLFMLCAFDKNRAIMQPAFCVSRPTPAGSYEVVHPLADYISGGPIINVDDGSVAGILIKSDPPKIKPPGPVLPRWHAEPLFAHKRWLQIGLVPLK